MIAIFLCGIAGFFCYEALRTFIVFQKTGVKEIHFGGLAGLVIRSAAYVAAGVISVFLNLDVVLLQKINWTNEFTTELTGCYLRAFGASLAGPASLSKWDPKAGTEGPQQMANAETNSMSSLDDLELHSMSFSNKAKLALRRLLLR